jgi:hypothetical protein
MGSSLKGRAGRSTEEKSAGMLRRVKGEFSHFASALRGLFRFSLDLWQPCLRQEEPAVSLKMLFTEGHSAELDSNWFLNDVAICGFHIFPGSKEGKLPKKLFSSGAAGRVGIGACRQAKLEQVGAELKSNRSICERTSLPIQNERLTWMTAVLFRDYSKNACAPQLNQQRTN